MIVITGPGRSGTSLVATIYKRLGIDPGGVWYEKVRAGLEDPDVVGLNRRIARDLKVRIPGRQMLPGEELVSTPRIPRTASRIYDVLTGRFRLFPTLEGRERIVERYREPIAEACEGRRLIKDPRFCWTLSIWLEARAPVEHVVICMRDLDRTVDSRVAMPFGGRHTLERRTLLVGTGLLQFTLAEYGIPSTTIHYPDSYRVPASLQPLLPGLETVDPAMFAETVNDIVDLPTQRQRET